MTGCIDLAAEAKNTAGACIEWSNGPRVVHVASNIDDLILRHQMADDIVKIGIDCPMGWPAAFVDFVAAHAAMRPVPPLRRWDLVYRRYKGPAGREVRTVIVEGLAAVIEFGAHCERCITSDHDLDAGFADLAAGPQH